VSGHEIHEKTAKKQGGNEEYEVAGLGDEEMPISKASLRLLPTDAKSLDTLESRLTSASLKSAPKQKKGASLSTVLTQALQSEDIEQLDWVLAQQENVLVE